MQLLNVLHTYVLLALYKGYCSSVYLAQYVQNGCFHLSDILKSVLKTDSIFPSLAVLKDSASACLMKKVMIKNH